MMIGVVIGWVASQTWLELDEVDSHIETALYQMKTVELLQKNDQTDLICIEISKAMPGLFEANAVKNAKSVLHWVKPNMLEKANQLEQEAKSILSSNDLKGCNGAPYFLNKTLQELGYDI